jgi:hypothetical protein
MHAHGFPAGARAWTSAVAALGAIAGAMMAMVPATRADDTVRIAVEGQITPKCALVGYGAADTRTMTILDLDSGRFQYGYNIECNAPFAYSVESENGALALAGQTIGPKRPEARLPYVLTVNIPTDDVLINDQCPSESLETGKVTCQFHDSRQGIALHGQATLTLNWNPPVTALPAGTYSDRLTFRVGVRQ